MADTDTTRVVLQYMQTPSIRYYYTVPDQRKIVAITIDDGPSVERTQLILNVLERHAVVATFFLIGERAAAHPELVHRIAEAGHDIGNHDWADTYSVLRDDAVFVQHLNRTELTLGLYRKDNATKLFRPGKGLYSSRLVATATTNGYKTIMGTIYPFDSTFGSYLASRLSRVWSWCISTYIVAKANPGSIIILHDGYPNLPTDETLDMVIIALKERGYQFATISQMESVYPD